jgi:HEAT repeat protein
MRDSEQTGLLIAMLTSARTKPGQRAQAARLLGESGDNAAIRPLIGVIEETADPFKLQAVTAVLGALPKFGSAAIEAYREVLASDDTMRRPFMPRLLAETGDPRVVPILLDCLHDREPEVVTNAITALGTLKAPEAFDALLALVEDPRLPPSARGVAASALGTTGDPRAFGPLAALLQSTDRQLLGGAIDGIAELGDERAVEPLRALLARAEDPLDAGLERGVRLALVSLSARQRERERGLR